MFEIYARTFMTATRIEPAGRLGWPARRRRGWLERALDGWRRG